MRPTIMTKNRQHLFVIVDRLFPTNLKSMICSSFGCEFIDDGDFGKEPPSSLPQIKNPYFHVPIFIIEKTLDQKYVATILTKDIEYIKELSYSIKKIGIQKPGLITFDENKIRLSDGNHRFLAAKMAGLQEFPVEIRKVDKIKTRSVNFSEIFPHLLELI